MTFLEAVNRILRINTIISGDDDELTSFSDVQHVATMNLAKIAVQSTINELTADTLLPYEEADGTITAATSTRAYALPSDFIRFSDEKPFLLELDGSSNSANTTVSLYPGGEARLRREVLDYREQEGNPIWFYLINTTTKQIGLYQVPNSSKNGTQYRFPYHKSIMVTAESDTIPFHNDEENFAFVDMCARKFDYLLNKIDIQTINQDPVYRDAKVALVNLLRGVDQPSSYGYEYQ